MSLRYFMQDLKAIRINPDPQGEPIIYVRLSSVGDACVGVFCAVVFFMLVQGWI